MSMDPRDLLARSPMGRMQMAAVVICNVLIALDGFDGRSQGHVAEAVMMAVRFTIGGDVH